MKPIRLNELVRYDIPKASTASDEALLYAEIAERCVELDEMSWPRFVQWTGRLHALQKIGRRITLWYLFYQSGDHQAIGRTLKEAGLRHDWTKQAEEQELKKELEKARSIFPRLVTCIEQLLDRSTEEDEPGIL